MRKQEHRNGIPDLWKQDRMAVLLGIAVCALLLGGLLRVPDYGVSYDEPLEYRTSVYTWEYMKATIRQLANGEALTDTTGFLSYPDRVYGCAARLPVFLLLKDCGSLRTAFLGWHFYTFLWFVVAVFSMYALLRELGFHRCISWAGSLMYVMMPRLLAEASYNIKDSLFLSLFTVTLYLGCRLLKRQNVAGMVLYSFFLALCTNTRYIGAAAFFLWLLPAFWQRRDRRQLRDLAIIAVCTAFFYYVMTPFLWTDPVGHFLQLVGSFTDNGERYVSMWFAGRQTGADALPWYYLLLWMGLTIPLWVLACFAAGAIAGVRILIKKKTESLRAVWLCGAVILLTTAILADALMHTVKYDGWRHFYFLYALLVPVAAYGLERISKKMTGSRKKAAVMLLGLSLLLDMGWPFFLHPYEMVYMNPLGMPFNDSFETDYWLVSMTGAIREILSETEGEVRIWLGWETGLYLLEDAESARVIPVESIRDADYVIMYDRVYRWNGIPAGELEGFRVWKEKRVGKGLLYHILVPQTPDGKE